MASLQFLCAPLLFMYTLLAPASALLVQALVSLLDRLDLHPLQHSTASGFSRDRHYMYMYIHVWTEIPPQTFAHEQ